MRDPADSSEPTKSLSDDFAEPIDDRYFEDYTTGAVYEYGCLTVTEAEIPDRGLVRSHVELITQ